MALKDYPNWVLIHKGKGREIRCINGKYYLYLVHTQRVEGKVKKFTDKYLGRITEEGLIPPVEKQLKYIVKIYGLTAFIFSTCDNIINSIISRYPSRFKKLLPLSILKYFFNNNISEYNNHYISILFPDVIIKSELDSTLNEIERICNMFNHAVSRIIEPITLDDFKVMVSNIYIVGIKDKWTIATIDELSKNLIGKYKINLEIGYGKN